MKNHEPIDHLILILSQMDLDITRIAIQADESQSALLGDCAEHRIQILNKLRHIRQQWQNPLDRQLVSRTEILRNAHEASFALAGDDHEITPETKADPVPSALARYRQRQRCAYLAAWVIAVILAAVILSAIRFAVQHAPF